MDKLPIYNIVLGDAEGITKMSLVESPAVESDFLAFDKQEKMKFSMDEEQHIVFGCALRADFPIYRESEEFGQYYVVFSKDTIKQLYEKFMKDKHIMDVNVDHSDDVNGVYMIQSFIKNSNAGMNPVGFEDISEGSWFVAYKVENEEVWEKVKTGDFKGFSVEMYSNIELKSSKQERAPQEIDDIEALIDELLDKN